jgi:hypothetical protein
MKRALLLVVGLAACPVEPGTSPLECDTGELKTCDPALRCIKPGPCSINNDCSAGLTCGGNRLNESVCGGTPNGVCVPRQTAFFNPFELIDGFRTQAMQVTVAEETPLTLSWETVDARFVACAVFSCAPQVLTHEGTPVTAKKPINAEIYDFDKCAAYFETVTADTGIVRLRTAYGGENTCAQINKPDSQSVRVYDDLLAACWAYDKTMIVAASELIRLNPDVLAQFESTYGTCQDNAPCYRGDITATFGLCRDGVCQARCTTDADCLSAARVQDPEAPEPATCPWSCVEVPDSSAKVCVPRT